MIIIPDIFLDISYDTSYYPGAKINKNVKRANCQIFAYGILRYFGYNVPDFRSSELWNDTIYTKKVSEVHEFDILFWNKTDDPYGAHLGLYLGENKIIHLSKKIGKPVIWNLEEFIKNEEYSVYIGAKRVLKK